MEIRRKSVSFSPCHFWIEFNDQHSSLLFVEVEEESVLEPCLLKWKVHVIHHFGATIMKLQGTIFLLPSIKNLSSSLQFKPSLVFSSVYTEMSLLPSSWSFHCFVCVIQKSTIQHVFLFCIYLLLLFSPQGNLLDRDSISFQTLLSANSFYSNIPWYFKRNNYSYSKISCKLLRV